MLFHHPTQPGMQDHHFAALQPSPQHASTHCRQSVGECRAPTDDECNPRRKRQKVGTSTLSSSSPPCGMPFITSSPRTPDFAVRFVNCLPPLPDDAGCGCQPPSDDDMPMSDGMDVDMSAAVVGSCTDRVPSQRSSKHWSPCSQQLCWQAVDYANRKLRFSYVDEVDLQLEQLFATYKLQQQQASQCHKQRYQPREAAIAEDDDMGVQAVRPGACGKSAAAHVGGVTFANCLPPLPAASPTHCWPAYA